jgi:hypothetical protein
VSAGHFSSRMEAKDSSIGFDFAGKYMKVVEHKLIESAFGESTLFVEFIPTHDGVKVRETFESEVTDSMEQQRSGWQAILDDFKKHVESRQQPKDSVGHRDARAKRFGRSGSESEVQKLS